MNHPALIRRIGCGVLLASLAVAGFAQNGHWDDDCSCTREMRWGNASWVEPYNSLQLTQTLDFFPVTPQAKKQPLVIYAHGNFGTKTIVPGDPMWDQVILPARAAGFAVASIEFRHPVVNDDIVPAPHDDLTKATRWLIARADTLGIDRRNVFYLGKSRGSLLLWTALARGGSGRPPLQVNAVYTFNGQVSYRGQELADRFVIESDREEIVADWLAQHPQDPLFGSALASVDASDPPLLLKVEEPFFNRLVSAEEINVHHPDFALAVCAAYTDAGIGSRCQAIDQVRGSDALAGFVPFFQMHLR